MCPGSRSTPRHNRGPSPLDRTLGGSKMLSALRSPLSALRSPLSALRSPLSALRSPLSALRSPLSALRSPLSALRSPGDLPMSGRLLTGLITLLGLLSLAGPSAQAQSVNADDRVALQALTMTRPMATTGRPTPAGIPSTPPLTWGPYMASPSTPAGECRPWYSPTTT